MIYIPGCWGSQCFSTVTRKLCLSSMPTASATVSSISFSRLLISILAYRSPVLEVLSSTLSKKMATCSPYGTFRSIFSRPVRPPFWIACMAFTLKVRATADSILPLPSWRLV